MQNRVKRYLVTHSYGKWRAPTQREIVFTILNSSISFLLFYSGKLKVHNYYIEKLVKYYKVQ